jgi:hypothetical protein
MKENQIDKAKKIVDKYLFFVMEN